MLPDILSKIELWIKENELLQSEKTNALISLLKHYKKNEWIYPGVLIRKLNISAKEAYHVLEFLKSKQILETNYEIYCRSCSQFKGKIYSTFSQVPEKSYCYECNTELLGMDSVIVIYKVINDGTD